MVRVIGLMLLLSLWLVSPALATCTQNTVMVNGQMKFCQTCCEGGQCQTFCL